MGTAKPQTKHRDTSQKDNGSNQHFRKRKPKRVDELPGVQKIKASIRQTKRLLTKDNLNADVRVATERRLKSLENDLAKAELARTERTMSARYHKVKFFERKKAIRRITQIKRLLETGLDADGEKLGKKQKKAFEKELLEKRIDLNYIMHYPKTKKYVSLYPHSTEEAGSDDGKDSPEEVASNAVNGGVETDKKRQELRESVRAAMKSGEMTGEPELHLSDLAGTASIPTQSRAKLLEHSIGTSEVSKKSKRKKDTVPTAPDTTKMDFSLANDDFFDIEDD
ncbi:hypothetical protein CPB86DRAFT_786800 [Serendipita vermifera]|nr:hypothetical protein CPB86DRAFT_786800 [Serendipita vermifera]